MREAATCRRGNENAGLGTNRFYRVPASFSERYAFELIEIPAGKRGKNADIKRILDKEGEQMLAAAGKNRIVTLDIPGKPWDTPQLAAELERWKLDGRDVSLLIGGPVWTKLAQAINKKIRKRACKNICRVAICRCRLIW